MGDRPYHHGDLREALIEAGLTLTRQEGPEALRMREVTRAVGVSPNAAYRHFADRRELLDAVGQRIQHLMVDRMVALRSGTGDRATQAIDGLRAVGLGYIDFALGEPGWFAVAFFPAPGSRPEDAAPREAPPYRMLVDALDEMVAAGLLGAAARDGARWACWATVHGFAGLATRGPLAALPPAEVRRQARRVVEAIIDGVCRERPT
ncbi:TetR/AcrR family transcriptional regulator [Aeromicrobium sp. Leaf350]|uniref:TetR/AcrR family transcriptional regulator n=1 Tax=Aeromicrobium sp. Leaf350 TaxID=2876565 RepID=UPI001E4D2D17|nr:TetR/AcrR family transcriptional regulator [Aeromicrobium sp. Leaf350]